MFYRLMNLLFPPKCILCQQILSPNETDLCHTCRSNAPEYTKGKFNLSFIARWTAVWYYKDTVRESILRYKFGNRRSYASVYGRHLAMKLQIAKLDDFDVLSWIPISGLRRLKRRFDQVELLADAVAKELNVPAVKTLKKIRHTRPQSSLRDAAQRRANVLNAYRAVDKDAIAGKRVLLLDDVLTTGATASECARTLLTAGAKEVYFAAIAVASHNDKK